MVLFVYSFNASKGGSWGAFPSCGMRSWSSPLPSSGGHSPTASSSLGSALGATVLGTLAAVGTSSYEFWYRPYVRVMSFIPMILPEIIVGVSLLVFFTGLGLRLGLLSVWIAHTTFNVPFVYLLVSARLEEFDPSVVEAAEGGGEAHQRVVEAQPPQVRRRGVRQGLRLEFINFIHRPEIYAEFVDAFGFPATVNYAARPLKKGDMWYKAEDLAKYEIKRDLGPALDEYNKIWQEIRVGK